MRFELFRRLTVKGQKAYTFNVREVTPAILGELWEFFADEHKHFDTYPKIYAAVPEKRKPKPRGENAIIDMFSRLRTFFNWCLDSGYITVSPFRQFSVPEPVYGTPVYITAEELRQIADFDFSNHPALAVQRDIFVFQCCVGCRIGDLYRMTWSNVEGDVFDYIAGKTKDDNPKTISVPLVTMAKKILKRYESSGRATILPFISEQKYNDAIKEVFRQMDDLRPQPPAEIKYGDICTPEFRDSVIAWVEAGGTVTEFCKRAGISKTQLYRSMKEEEGFHERLANARLAGYDSMAEEALRIASEPSMQAEEVITYDKDGNVLSRAVKRSDAVYARKLAFQARLQLLAKWAPNKYGEKVVQEDNESRATKILEARRRVANGDA